LFSSEEVSHAGLLTGETSANKGYPSAHFLWIASAHSLHLPVEH